MKKVLFSILGAFMVSTMASAQYVNVRLEDGTWRSFKATPNTEVFFGEKAGAEVAVSARIVTIDNHTVTVKLSDNIPASDVMFGACVAGESVKIKVVSIGGYGLECVTDKGNVITPAISNKLYTFTVSDITNDAVVTIGYK